MHSAGGNNYVNAFIEQHHKTNYNQPKTSLIQVYDVAFKRVIKLQAYGEVSKGKVEVSVTLLVQKYYKSFKFQEVF